MAANVSPVLGLAATPNEFLIAPLLVGLGAIPGALSRYYLTIAFAQRLGTAFPYGTLFINLTGAFTIGFFMALPLDSLPIGSNLRLLVATGFLGAYTTFSTYGLETVTLLQTGNYGRSLLYWAGSIGLGGIAVAIGHKLAQALV